MLKNLASAKLILLWFIGLAAISGCSPNPGAATSTAGAISTGLPGAATPNILMMNVEAVGCSTSVDVTHGMGEVTDAYVNLSNESAVDLPNVCVTLNGNDESRQHPNKTVCMEKLPADGQITQKLTIDTTFRNETMIQIVVTSQGKTIFSTRQNCQQIEASMLERLRQSLGQMRYRNK